MKIQYDASGGHGQRALSDLWKGLLSFRLVKMLTMRDVRGRYHGAVLGIYWVVLTTGATAVGLGIVYSIIFGAEFDTYLPFIATGLTVWAVLTALVAEGSGTFVNGSAYFLQTPMPLSISVFRLLGRTLVQFFYRIIALLCIYLYVRLPISESLWMLIPGLFLFFYCGFWIALIAGCINARYRDFGQFSLAFMTVSFFITPVFWTVDRLGEKANILYYNPFFNLMEIVRGPIINSPRLDTHFLHVLILAVLLTFLGLWVYSICHRRLPYWCS